MVRKKRILTAKFIEGLRKPGKYCDRDGLILRVYPTGKKTWEQRFTVHGRRRHAGLGVYPKVTLKQARALAASNRQLVEEGQDPIAVKRRTHVPTLTALFEVVLKTQSASWRNPKEPAIWRQRFDTYIAPHLGKHPVSDIEPRDVLDFLEPLYEQKTETGRRVRQMLRTIMDRAVTNGHCTRNPAGDVISKVLPRMAKTKTHFRALPHSDVGAALRTVRGSTAALATKLAFEFVVLNATRSGEVRNATWAEIDLATMTWTIPAERMKTGVRHRVPLSLPAMAVLDAARNLDPAHDLVFPSPRGAALSNATLSVCLRTLKIKAVPHGFRSSFRDWCADTGVDATTAEKALAHYGNDPYQRTDLFELRRPVMNAWAAYVCETAGPKDPTQIPETEHRAHQRARRRARRQTIARKKRPTGAASQYNLFEDAS